MSEGPAPAARDAIVAKLLELFRRDGFEGVSIADVAAATGLGKSSLYHHFPGGKEEMARAVIDRLRAWTEERLVAPLRAPGSREGRLDRMFDAVVALYAGGRLPCAIASMLVGARDAATAAALREVVAAWLSALADALAETGARPDAARAAALDALARIQGALILSRLMDDGSPFAAALAAARRDLAAA